MSNNVFADIGLPDPDTHLVKAQIVSNLGNIITDMGLTQAEVAKLTGWTQPKVSNILRGRFREISIEKLIEVTNALSHNVRITIEKTPVKNGRGKTTVLVG
jgi:predicted XRE-type DNA-binding protein